MSEQTIDLLAATLTLAVPIEVARQQHLPWAEVEALAHEAGDLICGPAGADLLFKSKKPGDTAKAFAALARGLAALSFCPGGVRFFGLTFENKHSELAAS